MDAHKAVSYKEKEIEEVNRRLTQAEDDFHQKSRVNKNTVEEQLHGVKMQHSSDLKTQQDDMRRMRDTISKLEDRVKSAIQSEQNKERMLMESERKYSELSDKITSLTSQMKIERDNNDRLCLENEDLKRKLNKEEARCRKALEDLKEYENEIKVHTLKNEEVKKQLVEEKETFSKRERPLNSEEDQMKINLLAKKVADLKEKLKMASDKLVKCVSEKVILFQRLRDAGIDINETAKNTNSSNMYVVDERAEKKHNDMMHQGDCPVHHHNPHHHHHHPGPMQVVHAHPAPVYHQGPQYSRENFYPEPLVDYTMYSHETKPLPPVVASVETTPFTSTGFHTGDKYLVNQRTYEANVADLTEDELQLKIKHLLTQKESYFTNA